MKYLIILSFFIVQSKAEVALSLEFDRMRQRSNYSLDLHKVYKEGTFFFLWVEYEDVTIFSYLKEKYPNAVHCYMKVSELEDKEEKGLIIGMRRKLSIEKIKTFKGVILISDLAVLKAVK